uniref:Uncharacterized protein n=1 Tax=Panthera leo TaxID=9689 RepID=A0A8C8WT78_PANLE
HHDHFQEMLVMTTHLFFGGTETTSTTLRYGLLILLKYPEVGLGVAGGQDTRRSRPLPKCSAPALHQRVLHEFQRFISVLPLGLPRALTRDTHLRGYFLPKGTFVIPLLVSSHQDPTPFKDPDCFNPTNFLDKGEFQSRDAFMPFAPGKRMCLGAGLARSETFLFLTTILQEPHQHRPHPAVRRPGQYSPSLPAPPGGPLRPGSAALCSLALRPPYLPSSIKALNCKWTGLLTIKRERKSQKFAALR